MCYHILVICVAITWYDMLNLVGVCVCIYIHISIYIYIYIWYIWYDMHTHACRYTTLTDATRIRRHYIINITTLLILLVRQQSYPMYSIYIYIYIYTYIYIYIYIYTHTPSSTAQSPKSPFWPHGSGPRALKLLRAVEFACAVRCFERFKTNLASCNSFHRVPISLFYPGA